MSTEPEHSEVAHWIGCEIRRLRKENHLTQRELAESAGVVQQNLSLYERGVSAPRLETLERILDSLGAEMLIRRKDESWAGPGAGEDVSLDEVRDLLRRLVTHAKAG